MSGELADDAVNAGIAEGESHVITPLEEAKLAIRMAFVKRNNLMYVPDWEELPKSERDKLNSWALKKVTELLAENAVLKRQQTADAKRLDWLGANIGYEPLQISWNDDYTNCWSLHSKQIGSTGKTLREAIDAAVRVKP